MTATTTPPIPLISADSKVWRWCAYGLFACIGVVIISTFLDYGLTWDEQYQSAYGDYVIKWYGSFFQDRSALEFKDLYLYGGFFECIAQLLTRVSPFDLYETRHLINAIFGLFGIIVTYRIGCLISSLRTGLFAALCLTLTPMFYGHMFNNSKDIPVAAMAVLSVYYIFLSYNQLPHIKRATVIKLGIAIGLTLGIRFGVGVLVWGYLVILWGIWLVTRYGYSPASLRAHLSSLRFELARPLAFITGIAFVVMLVSWPWAQVSPIKHPLRALRLTARFVAGIMVFHDGRSFPATDAPVSYIPTWLAISLPEFYFITLLVGAVYAVKRLRDSRASHSHEIRNIGMLLVVALLPILSAIVLRTAKHDAIRHFLFIIPALSLLAGISLSSLLDSRSSVLLKGGVVAAILISVSITIVDMVRLHPYQYIYFNRAVAGGLKNASSRFETDYWGASYKEGIEWIVTNYRSGSKDRVRVANCSEPFLTGYFLEKTEDIRQRFVNVANKEDADIFLATTRYRCHETMPGNVIYVVKREDTPLLYVIEVSNRRDKGKLKMEN